MKCNLYKILVLLFILTVGVQMAQAVDNTPPEAAMDAAKAAMGTYLGNADQEELAKFGFNSREEFNHAAVGDVFKVHFLQPHAVLNTIHADSLLSVSDDTSIWQFLVLSTQGAACMVTVDNIDNQWIAVSVGGAGLAKQLYEMIQTWPKSGGYELALIKSLQAKSDFLEVYQNQKLLGIIPLVSAKIAMDRQNMKTTVMLTADDILETLVPVVKQNLKQFGTEN
jgi:hypothetical protein